MAHSNQDYVRKFEELKIGIEGTAVEHVNDAPNIGAIERGPSTTTRSLPGAPTRKFGRMRFATGRLPLQENENARSLGSRGLATATSSPPKAQSNVTRSLATSPNAPVSNVLFNTSVQTNIAMPPVQERGIPTTEAPTGFEQEALFKQLEHYSMLITNLLKEVDEAQYKITFKSRLRVKGGIAGLHESERQELERIWGGTAMQSAEQKLESLVEGLEEMPMISRVAAREPGKGLSPGYMRRKKSFLPMAANLGFDNKEQEEAAGRIPQPIPDRRLFHFNSGTGIPTVKDPSDIQTPVNEAVAKEDRLIGASEGRRTPSEMTTGAFRRDYSVAYPEHYPSHKKNIKPPNPVSSASTDKLRSGETSASLAEADTNPTKDSTRNQMYMTAPGDMIRRQSGKGLALRVPPSAGNAKSSDTSYSFGGQSPQSVQQSYGLTTNDKGRVRAKVAHQWISAQVPTPRRDFEGTDYSSVGNLGRRTGSEPREKTQNFYRRRNIYAGYSAEFSEEQNARAQYMEKGDDTAPDEHLSQSREEFSAEGKEELGSNRESIKKRESQAQKAKAEPEQIRRDQVYNLAAPKTRTTMAMQAPRNQPNLGPPSAVSPQNNGQLPRPPMNQPPISRPHQMLSPIARPLPNVNANSRPPEQQNNSPHVAPPAPVPSTTQEPIPLSHQVAMAQARSYSHPNFPRPFVHGHPPHE